MTIDQRLTDIERRLAIYSRAARLDQAKPGSINHKFLGEDVPWLIAQLRDRGRIRVVT